MIDHVTSTAGELMSDHPLSRQIKTFSSREDSAIAVRDHEVSQIILKRNLTLAGGSSLVIGAIIGKFLPAGSSNLFKVNLKLSQYQTS